ncbi:hypothetical protein LZP69_09585 [Shewanella sp. AS1]|uniref:hypothetical protein n=1 Tax=Shewanella sp. AS1 TaxID=2907626 RepID=UPI001F42E5B8|nr:hypothetical protein [Shewanella sp. AS1]MCE9679423.1 hypothetical protein [Shewanella sp. AS1]
MDFPQYTSHGCEHTRFLNCFRPWMMGAALLFCASPSAMEQESNSLEQLHELSVFDQRIRLQFPSNWRLAHQDSSEKLFAAEFIPKGQMLADWSALYCVQGVKGLAEDVEPETFLDTFASHYKYLCDGTMEYKKLGRGNVSGNQSFSATLSCSKMPHNHGDEQIEQGNKAEIGHYTVIALDDDFLILHQSARGDALEPISSLTIPASFEVRSNIISLR